MTRQNVQIVLVAIVLISAAGMAAGQTEELVRDPLTLDRSHG